MCILNSLCSQTSNEWEAHVIFDGYLDEELNKIIQFFSNNSKIKFTVLDQRNNDFGHTPRNIGLEQCNKEWVIMTGDDNYYTPNFVQEVTKIIDIDTKFVYCDMIHNGYDYQFFKTHHSSHYIDIGNMIMKTELAKQLKLDTNRIDADGELCNKYISNFCSNPDSIKKINKILYVHN
jgi:hypothetical protein